MGPIPYQQATTAEVSYSYTYHVYVLSLDITAYVVVIGIAMISFVKKILVNAGHCVPLLRSL